MSIEVSWDETLENVAYYKFRIPWSWDEFIQSVTQQIEAEYTKQVERYDVIGDFTESTGLPNGSGITHVAAMFRIAPKNLGITVVITNNTLIRTMVNIFVKIYPQRTQSFVAVQTREQAYALIRQARQQ